MKKSIILFLLLYSCNNPTPKDTYWEDTFVEYLVKGQMNGRISQNDSIYTNEFLRIQKTGQINDSLFIFMDKFKEYVTAGKEFKF